MIDYDSFSCCHFTDIFFRFSRGSKRVKHGQTSLTDILSQKRQDQEDEGETNPTTKKKKTDGPDKTRSGSTAATSEVQVKQIATEIQSAHSVTSDSQQPEEPYRCRSKAPELESPNSEVNVKLDAILNFSKNSQK